MIELALRRLRRHWRLNAATLLCLVMASALLAGFSGYTVAIATQDLQQNLAESSPAERSILITGTRYTFTEELYARLQEALGQFLEDRLVIRHAISLADPLPARGGQDEPPAIALLEVYSFNRLPESVRVVEGRLPNQVLLREATEYWRPPPIEAVIGARAAAESGLGVGDRLSGNDELHRLNIVGIVEPLDADDDVWGEDLGAFATVTNTESVDAINMPVIIAPASIRISYPEQPVFWHEVSWRITLNHDRLSMGNAQALYSNLINFQTQSATVRATVSTGMVQILDGYLTRLSRIRMAFFLLTAQTFFFVLYTLTLFTSSLIERTRAEMVTLFGRGASRRQIIQVFGLENLFLAAPAALILGPALAQAALWIWSATTEQTGPGTLPREAWLLSVGAVGLSWLALLLPVLVPTRSTDIGSRQPTRPEQQSTMQKRYIDLYLLAFSALLYWQLSQAGSFVMSRLGDTPLADPLLLIGPTLLLVAVALVSLRGFPPLMRLASRISRRLRGTVLPLALARLARDPLQPARAVLLVGLTAGLMMFALTFSHSLADGQESMAHYQAGAALRVSVGSQTGLEAEQLAGLPGVLAVSPALRWSAQTEDGRTVQLLAVDPDTFDQVARYPGGFASTTISDTLRALTSGPGEELPAAVSPSMLPSGRAAGSQITVHAADSSISFTAQVVVDSFPTLSDPFIVVSLTALEDRAGLSATDAFGTREAWVEVDPVQHERLADHPVLEGLVLDNALARLEVLRADALAQGTSGVLQLNAFVLLIFSVTAFFLTHWASARGRWHEFSTLRAEGLSPRQWLAVLITEGIVDLGLGLLAGAAIGLGLSRIMTPYLSQALAESLGGVTVEHLGVDWATVLKLYLSLIAVYGLALVAMVPFLSSTSQRQALWREEE